MNKKPIRIGVVGLGKIAQSEHLPAILKNPEFDLAFVVDRAVELDLDVASYSSLEEALRNGPEFDAISICTSPQVRYELCEQLFEVDCAILLEKPAAAEYALAETIRERAKSLDRCLFCTWHSRFASQVSNAKKWVQKNEIISGEIQWRENAEKWHPGQDWIWREGGFGVFDPGMNALSILTEIHPSNWTVVASEIGIPVNAETPSTASFTLSNGIARVQSYLEFHAHQHEIWRIRLSASNGDVMDLINGGAEMMLNGEQVNVAGSSDEYGLVYQRFSRLIREHKSDVDLSPLKLIHEIIRDATTSLEPPVGDII